MINRGHVDINSVDGSKTELIHVQLASATEFIAIVLTSLQDDELTWRSPPSRQLSRERRIGYESDVQERFYDDYIGDRTSEMLTCICIHEFT